ncbi:Coenzyme F420 hydrogenase/dehydrogenase, beta subunit C-terminal domain [uncultured Bacteroides sp.]|uniref:Coenzyme F420 hydrogenase/dehydrogenase, beta subunit C-terminal domain n=1 Tax=uncultured Bacteroides sp. TaxID=162156 RepID=UPI00344C0096
MNKIELCNDENCTQCCACQTICPKKCISMQEAKDGFFVPVIDYEACIACGTCVKACHRLTSGIEYQTPKETYACWTKLLADRKRSSSGGAFSVIARKILSLQGIVYGASMCPDLKVRHIGIECVDDLIRLQGSKYLQSYVGSLYKEIKAQLCKGRKVLFTGTPCQVAGLLTYLHRRYDNLYTCDLVCHGVPSQKAFDIYVDKIGLRGKCKNVGFRCTDGWGYQMSKYLVFPTKNEYSYKKVIFPRNAYYLRAFTQGLMFSEACYSCVYARPERVSDITLADYWGIGVKIPFNYPTSKGVSLMLVNSEKALSLLNDCSDLFMEKRPLEEAIEGNYNLSHVSKRPEGRNTYFEDSQKLSIDTLSAKYGIKSSVRDYLRLLKQMINSFK